MAAIGDQWPPAQVDAVLELLSSSDGKFPSGIRKLPSDLISAVQRERLIAAMLQAASELGYGEATVQHVIERAGVSRPTFYEHFTNKEDCFLAAFDATAARLRDRVAAAAGKGGDNLRDRLRFGLETLLHFASTEPEAARTLIVEARAASADAVMRRDELLRLHRRSGARAAPRRPLLLGDHRGRHSRRRRSAPLLADLQRGIRRSRLPAALDDVFLGVAARGT